MIVIPENRGKRVIKDCARFVEAYLISGGFRPAREW